MALVSARGLRFFSPIVAVAGVLAVAQPAGSLSVLAQETQKANPVGVGSAWQGTLSSASAVDGSTFDDGQLAVIDEINAYFNQIKHLRGRFAQTDAQNRTLKGRFFVQWPGRFRFDYARPSRLLIYSDGRFLRIEDLELKTSETYALASTPFRIILAKNVNILRDAKVLRVATSDTSISLALRDKKEDSGTIRLEFARVPEKGLELTSWIITDAQGLDTRIDVSQLVKGKPANPKLFKPRALTFPSQSSRN
ncbi:MAG: outer membrane lipoprotein carrier protein LolA [Pseudomonadota bacterium]